MTNKILSSAMLALAVIATIGLILGPSQNSAFAANPPGCRTVTVPIAGSSQVATYYMTSTYNGQCIVNNSAYSIAHPCNVVNGIASSGHCETMQRGYQITPNGTATLPTVEWFSFGGKTLASGQFLDLVDTTPFVTAKGHVAMILPCDKAGNSQVRLYEGIIDAGVNTLETPDAEYLQQLSTPGSAIGTYDGTCAYHFDIGITTNNPDGVTDFALVNNSTKSVTFGDRNTSTFSIVQGFLNMAA